MKPVYKVAAIAAGVAIVGAAVANAVPIRPMEGHGTDSEFFQQIDHAKGDRWFGGRGHGGPRGMGGPGGPGMQHMIREIDANNDMALSQDEIDLFIEQKMKLGDADGDGKVTLEEFEAIWLETSRPMMVRAFQRLDEDGSAAIETTEVEEQFGNIVKRLDRNDDGVLSRDDRRRGHKPRRHERKRDRN